MSLEMTLLVIFSDDLNMNFYKIYSLAKAHCGKRELMRCTSIHLKTKLLDEGENGTS